MLLLSSLMLSEVNIEQWKTSLLHVLMSFSSGRGVNDLQVCVTCRQQNRLLTNCGGISLVH